MFPSFLLSLPLHPFFPPFPFPSFSHSLPPSPFHLSIHPSFSPYILSSFLLLSSLIPILQTSDFYQVSQTLYLILPTPLKLTKGKGLSECQTVQCPILFSCPHQNTGSIVHTAVNQCRLENSRSGCVLFLLSPFKQHLIHLFTRSSRIALLDILYIVFGES